MNIKFGNLAFLCLAWAFFVGLVGVGMTVPTFLMVIATVLYLVM